MKTTKEMPTSGQFVTVFEYNGKVWCDTYKYSDEGTLKVFNNDRVEFYEAIDYENFNDERVRYFITSLEDDNEELEYLRKHHDITEKALEKMLTDFNLGCTGFARNALMNTLSELEALKPKPKIRMIGDIECPLGLSEAPDDYKKEYLFVSIDGNGIIQKRWEGSSSDKVKLANRLVFATDRLEDAQTTLDALNKLLTTKGE